MISTHTLPNGLLLAIEPIQSASSVSMYMLVPGGTAFDTDELDGCAPMSLEMLFRGTKTLDSKELTHAMDLAGMQRHGSAGTKYVRLNVTTTSHDFDEAVSLLLALVLEPDFSESQVDASRERCLQGLAHLSDDPGDQVGIFLKSRYLNRPFHRSGLGTQAGLTKVSAVDLREKWARCASPTGSILAIAGAVDVESTKIRMEQLTAGWQGHAPALPPVTPAPGGRQLLESPTAQVHVAMAWDAPDAASDRGVLERIVCTALGGATSSRLFTEVRQRRSLCYSIGTRYACTREQGWCTLHAGTTPENAEELLETSVAELARIAQTLTPDEIERCRNTLISGTIMRGESSQARAAQLARDLAETGKIRSLDDRVAELTNAPVDTVLEHAQRYASLEPTMVAIGPSGSLPFEAVQSME